MALRLTLLAARSSKVQDRIDALIDAKTGTAAKTIRQMPEDDAKLLLFAVVRSVDPRWRFPARPTTPPAPGPEAQENSRRIIREMLIEHPELIYPALLALSDAADAHDPRRQDRTEDAA